MECYGRRRFASTVCVDPRLRMLTNCEVSATLPRSNVDFAGAPKTNAAAAETDPEGGPSSATAAVSSAERGQHQFDGLAFSGPVLTRRSSAWRTIGAAYPGSSGSKNAARKEVR